MQEKAYYRLNELQHHHGIVVDEIRFLVEQKGLRLSFLLQDTRLIMGKHAKQGFIGKGSTTVDAIISVDAFESLALFSCGKVKAKTVYLRQASFKSYSPSYPFKIKAPNSEIVDWQPSELSAIKQDVIVAKSFPREQQSNIAVMGDIFKMFSGGAPPPEPLNEKIKQTGDGDLFCEEFTFSLSDACLFADDLKRHGLLGSDTASKPHSSRLRQQDVSADEKPNRLVEKNIPQFHYPTSRSARLAERLIGHAPDAKSDALWSLVRKAMNDDELLDLIDPEREVLDITPDTLFWNVPEDAPEKEKKVARGSFKNTISKVKQKLS